MALRPKDSFQKHRIETLGHRWVNLQSPLVPAILLLVSLAGVNLGDHHRKVLWRATIVSLVMLAVGILSGAIPFFVAQ